MVTPDDVILKKSVGKMLRNGKLRQIALPQTPDIRLLLLDETCLQGPLCADEMRGAMDNPLYWVFCWASGQVLAEFLVKQPAWVQNKRVLDFGCGSGVVAIAAALAGAEEVIACDADPLALTATRSNARRSGVSISTVEDCSALTGHIDLITVADVLYDRANLDWLSRLAARADKVLMADSRLKDFKHPVYREISREVSCTLPDLDESAEFRNVRIYLAD